MATPTPADIIAQVDETIFALITDGASSKSFMGRAYTVMDVDKLKAIRLFYAKIEAESTPTTSTIPIVSNADFSCSDNSYSARTW